MDSILNLLNTGISSIAPFVILLGLLIFVHELGHFLVAKFFGVRVEVFSLGFGKKIFSFNYKGTTYALSLFPLGGYVKMFGDDVNADIPAEDKKFSFIHKPVLQRYAVVLAGPLMNLFFAIFLFGLVSHLGEDARAPRVGDVNVGTQAYQQGFRSGDRIESVDSVKIESWGEFQKVLNGSIGKTLKVSVLRDESSQPEVIDIHPSAHPNSNILSFEKMVGDIEGLDANSKSPTIGIADPKSIAGVAGLQTNDIITKIDGESVLFWRDLDSRLRSKTGKVKLTVVRRNLESEQKINDKRFGTVAAELKTEEKEFTLNLPQDRISSLAQVGIEPADLFLAQVVPGSPAALAGIKAGDKMDQINDKSLTKWEDVLTNIKSYNESSGPLKIKLLRDGQPIKVEVTPQLNNAMDVHGLQEKRFTVGIVPSIVSAAPEVVKVYSKGFLDSINKGIERSYDVTVMTIVSFIKLFKAEISPKNIGGFISIGQAASETFKIGIVHFISMMAVISINLFILNLLPVPVLDGGHLVFYTIELLKGSPLSLKKMELAQKFGFVVLMSLMIFALFNDVSRLFLN